MLSTPLAPSLPRTHAVPSSEPAPAGALPGLYEYLQRVPDSRDPRGLRHPLPAILALACCALLCGARQLSAIAEWGRNHSVELRAALGFTRPQAPAGSTLHYVLQDLDWAALETQLRYWATAVEAHLGERLPPQREEAVALDGKTMRGAWKLDAEVVATVTALGHRLGLTLGAAEVREGNEIAAVEQVLRQLVLTGKVVTVDALHTQRKTAQLILEQGGQYVMCVKGNQPELFEAVQTLFQPALAAEQERHSVWETGPGHGRIENRWLLTLDVPVTAPEALRTWPGAAQLFVLERRVWHSKQRQGSRELVYGITSLPSAQATPEDLLRYLRGHWSIEVRSHYIRDVTFGEDASLVRTGKLPQVLALLRTAIISRLRADGVTNIAKETRRLAVQFGDCFRLLGLSADY